MTNPPSFPPPLPEERRLDDVRGAFTAFEDADPALAGTRTGTPVTSSNSAAVARTPAPAVTPTEGPPSERRVYFVTGPAILLSLVAGGFFLMFALIEPSPRWLVLVGTASTTLALDGVLRAGRRQAFSEGGLDTAPLLLVPALYMLAMPVFVEHATLGYATGVVALIAGAGYGALVVGQLSAVREFDAGRQQGRFIAAAATYLVAFALFALVFLFGVSQQPAALAVGLASTLLAAEIVREGEIDPAETLLYSLVAGVVVAETRWLIHYLPIDEYAGALTLLLVFYLVTGVLHSHVVRQLTRSVATTYAQVGVAGAMFIALARALGVA